MTARLFVARSDLSWPGTEGNCTALTARPDRGDDGRSIVVHTSNRRRWCNLACACIPQSDLALALQVAHLFNCMRCAGA